MHTTSGADGELVGSNSEKLIDGEAGNENIKEEAQSSKRTPTRILRYAEVQVHIVFCFQSEFVAN